MNRNRYKIRYIIDEIIDRYMWMCTAPAKRLFIRQLIQIKI
jgi:hypothetical protein